MMDSNATFILHDIYRDFDEKLQKNFNIHDTDVQQEDEAAKLLIISVYKTLCDQNGIQVVDQVLGYCMQMSSLKSDAPSGPVNVSAGPVNSFGLPIQP